MRTTVIPAQITTVEDKIAGNLNLTQIIILMIPVLWTAFVYVGLYPATKLSLYKLPLILLVVFVCMTLALRIKGKVVYNWLFILLRYNIRPKFYLFNKNDEHFRTMDLPVFEKKQSRLFRKAPAKKEAPRVIPNFGIPELVTLQNIIQTNKYTLSFKPGKKGGMYVAFDQIKK